MIEEISKVRDFKKLRRTGVFLLPSILTSLALFSGFFSIMHTIRVMAGQESSFWLSGIAILIAAFLDGMDGRIARLMNAESEFGFQFDSIADVVSFGVAPAVLVYAGFLNHLGRLGWFGAFLFVACASIRLARFNVISAQSSEKKYFKGLSSPVAAGGITLLVLIEHSLSGRVFELLVLGYTVFLAVLMVSNVRFRSFKKIERKKSKPVRSLMILTLILALVVSFQEVALAVFFLTYLFWGLTEEVLLFRRRRRSDPSVPFVPFGDRLDDEDSIV
ncbi:MAG: CDP-diacylglycerol--serine O-phosphatidyltransferase [Deltaproteobacteria bacterium CG11_big_fil_rev_8_21_14_0_20_45_16]|nr:MAG: CDP-diacylglycerol--serine O-phosphatidyltransferase [Deltaproteobacteria bacterium CG11_big_fil_rev_8_21_14_0_20_45_16]